MNVPFKKLRSDTQKKRPQQNRLGWKPEYGQEQTLPD